MKVIHYQETVQENRLHRKTSGGVSPGARCGIGIPPFRLDTTNDWKKVSCVDCLAIRNK